MPPAKEVVMITGSALTTILKAFVAFPAVFSALIVMLDVAAIVGVPEINPVFEFKLNPAGREPLTIDQVIGVVPLTSIV
jgi:hypothetical protein